MKKTEFEKMLSTLKQIDVSMNDLNVDVSVGYLTDSEVESETHDINLTCKVSEYFDMCSGNLDTAPCATSKGLLIEDLSFEIFNKNGELESLTNEQTNTFVKAIISLINTK